MEASIGRPEVLCHLLPLEVATQAVAALAEVLEDPPTEAWCLEELLQEVAWVASRTEVEP